MVSNKELISLQNELVKNLYGNDIEKDFVKDGKLRGFNPGEYKPLQDKSLSAQRGLHYPPPPQGKVSNKMGFPN